MWKRDILIACAFLAGGVVMIGGHLLLGRPVPPWAYGWTAIGGLMALAAIWARRRMLRLDDATFNKVDVEFQRLAAWVPWNRPDD